MLPGDRLGLQSNQRSPSMCTSYHILVLPLQIKTDEHRVAVTPNGVQLLHSKGFKVGSLHHSASKG